MSIIFISDLFPVQHVRGHRCGFVEAGALSQTPVLTCMSHWIRVRAVKLAHPVLPVGCLCVCEMSHR